MSRKLDPLFFQYSSKHMRGSESRSGPRNLATPATYSTTSYYYSTYGTPAQVTSSACRVGVAQWLQVDDDTNRGPVQVVTSR